MTDETKKPGVADAGAAIFQADTTAKSAGRTLKVRRIGNSLGVVLPKEVLAKLRVGEGDVVSVADAGDGVILSRDDSDTAELMKLAEDIMRKRRKVLRALAQ